MNKLKIRSNVLCAVTYLAALLLPVAVHQGQIHTSCVRLKVDSSWEVPGSNPSTKNFFLIEELSSLTVETFIV